MVGTSHTRVHKYKHVINNFARFPPCDEECKLDLHTKASLVKAASCVVCLKSFTGNKQLFVCCGIIMDCESRSGTYIATILTSATLLRCPNGAPELSWDLKIDVYMVGGKSVEGKVVAIDFHYNIATVEINCGASVSIPTIKLVDDTIDLGLRESQLLIDQDSVASSNRIFLRPGDKVFALGRFFGDPYDIMVASGKISFGSCGFDCVELLKASCKIKKNGIGGPLINADGEVIGINFYSPSFTPFLPMNIVLKCYVDLKSHRPASHPWLGAVIGDLYASSLHSLENTCNKFPHVVKGAIVKKVLPDSPAQSAGLCVQDVIVSCCGVPIGSFLELTEMIWDKEGKSVELVVVRPSIGKELELVLDAVKANPKEYRWPVPEPRILRSHPLHGVNLGVTRHFQAVR